MVTDEIKGGAFVRQPNRFTDPLTAEAGRYRLLVSLACPWAHRTLIVRRLLGLEDAISVGVVDPIRDERGWRFPQADPVTGATYLSELYLASDPSFTGRYTVPCVWDTQDRRLTTNDFPNITLEFETTLAPLHAEGAPDLYPAALRPEIDEINDLVYRTLNNGVYRAGFATEQYVYEEAARGVFATLDVLEERLATRRYLLGDAVTEADVRLYPTLARFDAAYHGHFKCNLRRLVDYPNLWGYARDLYAIPAFGETTDFDHIKRHYYGTHPHVNPTGIVPIGPLTDWTEPHDRA
ncbi:glutathione S-transferase family protein [Actinomadura flavalba]|uniref:glutathione S-transferase family protein n=1 Tax=Actinomadura flavalba TaxID=1120938 RepID=UPI000362A1AD|nr:glutathione S-transferase C-terminal domain-containing protein [Actinomadura flavalba]